MGRRNTLGEGLTRKESMVKRHHYRKEEVQQVSRNHCRWACH